MSIGSYNFTGFDTVVLLICLISLLMAASRGLAREIISVISLLLASAAALFAFGRFRFAAHDFIQPSWLADGALGIGSFAIAYLVIVFLLSGVVKSLKGKNVGFIDRILGAVFGVGRGLIACSLFVMFFNAKYYDAQAKQTEFEQLSPQQRQAIENLPEDIKVNIIPYEAELPNLLKNSTLYPIINKIIIVIRKLPFARIKTLTERLKAGDIPDLDDLNVTQ